MKIDKDKTLITTLYEKPTDTHLYLHYTSAHHHPCKTKGPYGQFLHLRRICSLDEDYHNNAKKLSDYYLKRGYPKHALKKHYKRVSKYNQSDLLDTKPKTTTGTPVMVTNYNPSNPNIRQLIMTNWNIISNSQDCAHIFQDKPIVGFRRLPNLRDQLMKFVIEYTNSHQIKPENTPKFALGWESVLIVL